MAGYRNHNPKVWLGVVAFMQGKKELYEAQPKMGIGFGAGGGGCKPGEGQGGCRKGLCSSGLSAPLDAPAPGSGSSSGRALPKGEAKQLGEEVKLAEIRPAGADLSGKIKILFI